MMQQQSIQKNKNQEIDLLSGSFSAESFSTPRVDFMQPKYEECEEDIQMETASFLPIQMQPIEEDEEMIQPINQSQDEEEEEEIQGNVIQGLGQAISETLLRHPPLLTRMCLDRAHEIELFLAERGEGSSYYYNISVIYSDFFRLATELAETEGETTETQRTRFVELQTAWEDVQSNIETDSINRIARELKNTRQLMEEIKLQLVLVYRQLYLSGEDSETEIVISETSEETTTLRDIADQVTGLLQAINEADAALSSRQVAPLVGFLSRANQFVNLILGWNFTGELDSSSQEAFDDLQNGLALALTAASFTAVAAYLPLFGHIPALLGAISKQWDRIVEGMRSQNTGEWEAFGKITNCAEEPGGCETLNYMISVFRTSSYEEVETPPEEAADFFLDRRDMFNTVANEVMDSWEVPTESEYLFFTVIDDDSFKGWVYFNRKWIWRLIYGDRSFPK